MCRVSNKLWNIVFAQFTTCMSSSNSEIIWIYMKLRLKVRAVKIPGSLSSWFCSMSPWLCFMGNTVHLCGLNVFVSQARLEVPGLVLRNDGRSHGSQQQEWLSLSFGCSTSRFHSHRGSWRCWMLLPHHSPKDRFGWLKSCGRSECRCGSNNEKQGDEGNKLQQ